MRSLVLLEGKLPAVAVPFIGGVPGKERIFWTNSHLRSVCSGPPSHNHTYRRVGRVQDSPALTPLQAGVTWPAKIQAPSIKVFL